MNGWPTLEQWLEFAVTVSAASLLLFALAKLISLRMHSAQRRRCLWQIAIVSTLLVAGGELGGVRQMVSWPQPSPEMNQVASPTRAVLVTIKDAEFPIPAAPSLPVATATGESHGGTSPSAWRQRPTSWPAWLWCSITTLLLGRILLGQLVSFSFRAAARRSMEADVPARVAHLAGLLGIGRRVTIATSAKAAMPFTFGVWWPVIVLPPNFTRRFTLEQQDAALSHELAHVAAFDSAWRSLSNVTCALLWWSPFTWIARRELDHASELVADESSLLFADGPDSLAECLVACANNIRPSTAVSWLGMDGDGFRSSLGRRISRLLRLNSMAVPGKRMPWPVRILVPLLCTLGVWYATEFVAGDGKASRDPWRNSLLGHALAAAQVEAFPDPDPNHIEAARLVQDGKLYYETDRLMEAETSLLAALKIHAESKAAQYYLALVRARRAVKATKHELAQPTPKAFRERPTSAERQMIKEKLQRIRLPEFGTFDNVPLTNVVRDLADMVRALDPEPNGLRFFLDPNVQAASSELAVDPAGLPVNAAADVKAIRIRLATQLKGLTLEKALDILVSVADRRIQYTIEDYGIVISPRADASEPPLHTRFFKIDADTLIRGLSNVMAFDHEQRAPGRGLRRRPDQGIDFIDGSVSTTTLIPSLKKWLHAAGVDLSTPGKAVFLNDRLGVVMVRATLEELDTVEKAMQMLNTSPPQLVIRVKVMEVPMENARQSLSLLGLTNEFRQALTLSKLLKPVASPATNHPSPTITSILTDEEFRTLIARMEKAGGTDLLSAPTITTLSGRQAQIKVVDVRYIVTDIDYSADGLPAGSPAEPRPIAEPFEIGPVVDIVPYVDPDGYTIQMTVLPTLREFLGYDEDPLNRRDDLPATGGPFAPAPRQVTPLPKFRTRQVASTARVRDGQTLVLGAGHARSMEKVSGPNGTITTNFVEKELFFFITPRLVDPAGNAVHSDDELRQRR